ncbi:cellulose synthase/poly-beta-1,6-N-acetylglucosamine synthase-like glycosyltransferase [Mycolicibacterium sp. BK556]|nr:cellulose synthase/poly-beta-1,6-N-acetylglucosamine synthase-like glycosyltransferase [Mycolicibacterium sp. BK556]MBB3635224.1 cellulose synthase/poly-beta-1,6-N-acetylglucosamine synthase-like glycosyltransferase [Mycolicibacterium sp. BK607]MBB3747982.1 cellulose synthase/poly-beta-1,6-N-acetylglucosamine synthase-like glycosyltransferase [Mycolicibacterium sp. BK634]TDO07883.1 cellulose synthase/poly-beta-1,6-N-acetylglucosamine synthase-like glycosyltransferase [Mycobacterium sp. BK086]
MPENMPSAVLAPHLSARTALGTRTLLVLLLLGAVTVAAIVAFPRAVPPILTLIAAALYLVSTIDRNMLMLRGIRSLAMVSVSDEDALAVADDDLPVYTVLLPVYQEPEIVQNLLDGVGNLNYPHDKLEVLLLVEDDDIATQAALHLLPIKGIRVVLVPHSLPKTKPKACNYGMSLAGLRGEMVTIYDAEDIPDPLQLRRAVVAFRRLPADVGCLQARLGYFNESQNLLTRWFSMEYDQWFGAVLPAVEKARCVVPLGGTSNHMRTQVWHDIGGWDEHNVTEDADLGVRLARNGYRTMILDSLTLEEANADLINWIRQRSRWYKGYLQTMIVHLRRPGQLRKEVGILPTLRLINMTGAIPLANASNLLLWSTMAVWIIGRPHAVTLMFPPLTYYLCLVLFMLAAPMSLFVGLIAVVAMGKPQLWWAALLAPGYWVLQSIAAFKAVYQLFFRPFYWEKTVHGLSTPSSTRVSVTAS